MDVAELLDEAMHLMDASALLAVELAPDKRHELIGPALVAYGLVKSARDELRSY